MIFGVVSDKFNFFFKLLQYLIEKFFRLCKPDSKFCKQEIQVYIRM